MGLWNNQRWDYEIIKDGTTKLSKMGLRKMKEGTMKKSKMGLRNNQRWDYEVIKNGTSK